MRHRPMSHPRSRRLALPAVLALLAVLPPLAVGAPIATSEPAAQELPTLTPEDYGRWERLGFLRPMSPDGRWIAVPISRNDGTSELRIHSLAAAAEPAVVAEGGTPIAYSSDSRWIAYRIGHSEAERDRMRRQQEPARNRMGLRNLSEGEAQEFDEVARFAFAGGAYLAMHRYPPERSGGSRGGGGGARGGDGDDGRTAADLVVLDLEAGTRVSFGNVADFAWQDDGDLLAIVIDAEDRVGNGVQLYDAASGALRVLDSAETTYAGLSWREDDDDLALLRAREDDAFEEDDHTLIVWRDLTAETTRHEREWTSEDGAEETMRIVEHRVPEFSDDGTFVTFGINVRHPAPDAGDEDADEAAEATPEGETAAPTDDGGETDEATGDDSGGGDDGDDGDTDASEEPPLEPSDVEVWHARDEQVIPMQKVRRNANARASYLVAWHLDEDRVVRLGTDLMESVTILEGGRNAVETDRTPYAFENLFDRTRRDVWLIDVATGERRKAIDGVWYFYGGSATGRYLLFFAADQYSVYDVQTGETRSLTAGLDTSFVNGEYDTPVREQDPPWGIGGWLSDDSALLLHDDHDVWAVSPEGSGVRLTDGDDERVRHRVVRLDRDGPFGPPREPGLDPGQPLMVSVYGVWTKQFGYGRVELGDGGTNGGAAADVAPVERLVWLDKNVSGLAKAEGADVYTYLVQGFDDSPDLFVAGSDLADARQVTETNPFQADYAWGRSELIDYETGWGVPLQGALYYPADYEPGRRYPMIVYVYERLSQGVHGYDVPSERSPYSTSVFTQQGYFVLRPDIVYRDRMPGTSAVESVVPAVQAVLDTGRVDPDRVGLVGHSWGGYEASFIPTQTDVFAASVAGAALTNFFSMFGTVHWNQGLPESSHFETGQARMDVPYWEDLEAYVRESPVMFIHELETPMLLFFGDSDGVVDWHQGVELYNYARRAGKNLVMLVYPGENHSAGRKENQIDYHHRVLQWFGHYLKGDPAEPWITEGVSVLDRERELRRLQQRR